MSAAFLDMVATAQAILAVEVTFVRVTTFILVILGNISEILNIVIFVQRTFRSNSCAIYFLAAACTRLIFINFTILPNGLSLGYSIDPAAISMALCKIKFYVASIAAILPPTFIVLACIDRLILSSMSARARAWSQPHVAYRLLAGVSVFWTIVCIHALIGSTVYSGPGYSYCYIQQGSYTFFSAFYSIIVHYLLPPLLMTIFGLLTITNVRRAQRQVRPVHERGPMHRKDRYLLRMLLYQILVNIVFVIPPGTFQLYQALSANTPKDIVQTAWDSFFFALALASYYVPNCTAFYIYTLTASIFRQELTRLVNQCIRRLTRRDQARVTVITNTTDQILGNVHS